MGHYTIPCPNDLGGCSCTAPFDREDPDLIVWYTPDYGQVISAGTLQSWADYSTAGNNVVAPGGIQGGTLNGFPWIQCNPSGVVFECPTTNRYESATLFPYLTFLGIFKTANISPFNDFAINNFGGSGVCGNDRGMFLEDFPQGLGLHIRCTSIPVVTTLDPDTWYSFALTVEEDTGAGTADVQAYKNGVVVGSNSGSVSPRLTVGAIIQSATGHPDKTAGVMETLAFRRLLTPQEIQNYQTYFTQKYGV